MNPFSIDLKSMIEIAPKLTMDKVSGTSVPIRAGVNLFTDLEPSSEGGFADCITIYNTGGPALSPKFAQDECWAQIRCRNCGHAEGYATLYRIMDYFNGKMKNVPMGGNTYLGFWVMTNIITLEAGEQSELFAFVFNLRTIRKPGTGNVFGDRKQL